MASVYFNHFSELYLALSLVLDGALDHVDRFQKHKTDKHVHQDVGHNDSGVVRAVKAAIRLRFTRFALYINQHDQNNSWKVVEEADCEAQTCPRSDLSSDNLLFL